LYLSRFDSTLKHGPGSKIGKTDSLSRRPDWEIEVEKDNENETLVKPEWLEYHKWSLTICDGCFDTSKSSKM